MKHITRSNGLFVLTSVAFMACASGGEDDFGTGGAGGASVTQGATTAAATTAATTAASTTAATTGSGTTCAPQCSSDAVCQQTCAAVPSNEANCCDMQTGTCYVINSPTCPTQMGTGGMPNQY